MNNEPEEWEEAYRKSSQKDQPQSWEIDKGSSAAPGETNNAGKIGFWGGLGWGFILLLISGVLSGICQSGIPFFLGIAVAIGFLFSARTRMIFVGSVTIIATIFLVFIVVCGSMAGMR